MRWSACGPPRAHVLLLVCTLTLLTGTLPTGCGGDDGPPPEPLRVDLLERLADPHGPARALAGEYRLASSRERDGVSGIENRDYEDGLAGAELVMLDTAGPGVVTRFWSTFRGRDASDFTVGDRIVMGIEVDGTEVARGTLLELTSGDLPGLPRPWVAGRDTSSGGFQMAMPIHYQQHIRMFLVPPEEVDAYYQVDYRRLPSHAEVPSWDGASDAARDALYVSAEALWVTGTDRGVGEANAPSTTLEPGEQLTLRLDEPAVVRRVEIRGASADLSAHLTVDGQTVVEHAADLWLGTRAPTEDYQSALSGRQGAVAHVDYPFPVRDNMTLVLRNDATAPVEVAATVRYDAGAPDDQLGALRVDCGQRPAPLNDSYLVLDADDGPGQYVGQHTVMRAAMWGWQMLEGDHELRVDGDWTVLGTGTEDYFGGAYYFKNGPFALPTTGAPGWNLWDMPHLMVDNPEVAMYRHHLIDPISYRRSLRFQYESYATNTSVEICTFRYVFD